MKAETCESCGRDLGVITEICQFCGFDNHKTQLGGWAQKRIRNEIKQDRLRREEVVKGNG